LRSRLGRIKRMKPKCPICWIKPTARLNIRSIFGRSVVTHLKRRFQLSRISFVVVAVALLCPIACNKEKDQGRDSSQQPDMNSIEQARARAEIARAEAAKAEAESGIPTTCVTTSRHQNGVYAG
jgi:hypothetical protein